MKNKNLKWIFKGLGILALGLVGMTAVFLAIQIVKAPNLAEVDASPEGYLSTILDKDGEVVNTLYVTESNRIYVGLENIPKELQEAFIAIEDERFYEHHGVDLKDWHVRLSAESKMADLPKGQVRLHNSF